MAKKKQTGEEAAPKGEMPGGEMNQPHSEGLTEMPTGGAFAPAPAQGGAEGTRAIKDGGLMPGESQQQSDDAREGDMPGGGMTST